MKRIVRVLVFTLISVKFILVIFPSLYFSSQQVYILVIFALVLLNIFLKPTVSIFSSYDSGIIFWFLSSIMTSIVLYILTVVVSGFLIRGATTPNLLVAGLMVPSLKVNSLWSVLLSGLLISSTYNFFMWLVQGKKKT